MNLAVNARDAMPGGGRLTIETANIEVDDAFASQRPGLAPGRYARLRVSDTRHGHGQGDRRPGLRAVLLDQAEGPRDRSRAGHRLRHRDRAGGSIDIYSEVGTGTTVSVLLPATDEQAGPDAGSRSPAGDDVRGHGETILLVEDEVSLRELTRRILAR